MDDMLYIVAEGSRSLAASNLCHGARFNTSGMLSADGSQGAAVAPPLTQPPATPVIANPITGDYRIDGLLDNADFRWNKDAPMGSAVTVSYSFMSSKPTYGGTDSGGDTGFTPFNDPSQLGRVGRRHHVQHDQHRADRAGGDGAGLRVRQRVLIGAKWAQ